MTFKQVTLSFAIALVVALSASLFSLSQRLPAPLAYFSIALLTACLMLVLLNRGNTLRGSSLRAEKLPNPKRSTPGKLDQSLHRTAKPSAGTPEQGTVKWFSANKGFGFITRDNGQDIFVHFRSITAKGRMLREGQRVEFTVGSGSKGQQAEDVTALP